MYVKNFFPQYKGEIGIGDGVRGINTTASKIVCHEENGKVQTITTEMYGSVRAIREWKVTEKRKIVEWLKYGAFQIWITKKGKNILRFHEKSLTKLHGLSERSDQKCFGNIGMCRTIYSWGKFMRQYFRYENGKLAYDIRRKDKSVIVKWDNGKIALVIKSENAFLFGSAHGSGWFGQDPKRFLENSRFFVNGTGSVENYDHAGRLQSKGEYKNNQKVGEWILNRQSVYFIKGVPVPKKLWDTPAEKLNVNKVIKIKNAQLRASLLAKIGPERIAKETKYKIIHKDKKRGNMLMEFPVRVDDGNGRTNSFLRILRVKCPSTKGFYYLDVPDFVDRFNKRVKLDTCEKARQWTFHINNPEQKIVFKHET